MRTTAALTGVVMALVFAGCGGAPTPTPTPTPTPPVPSSSPVESDDAGSDAADPARSLASLAPAADRVRTDLETILYLNATITTAPAGGRAAVFGDLVELIRNRFGKDVDLFAEKLKSTGDRPDFTDSLHDLRLVRSRGMIVTDIASPTSDQVQDYFDAVGRAIASWNRDVSSAWQDIPDRRLPLVDPECGPDDQAHCHD